MNKKNYPLNGKECSVSELVRISGLSRHTIQKRLDAGWDAEKAVNTPPHVNVGNEDNYGNRTLSVKFTNYVPGVITSMQPQLGKIYSAVPYNAGADSTRSKMYYIITLRNSLPLIVYPGEFQVIGYA